jgi:hypothetical protein
MWAEVCKDMLPLKWQQSQACSSLHSWSSLLSQLPPMSKQMDLFSSATLLLLNSTPAE